MADLASLTLYLSKLERMKYNGQSSVSYNGRTISYRSLDEINQAIESVKSEIAVANNTPRKRSIRARQSSRGY